MNIGIIIFSRTGNTLSVAEHIRDACAAQGHTAIIERVVAEDEDPNTRPVRIKHAPDPARFDAVIFGAPVQAFSLSPVMKAYLQDMPPLKGKHVRCFVTQHFPKAWMGGNQALVQMKRLCRLKGADVAETGNVNWMSKARPEQIASVAARLGGI